MCATCLRINDHLSHVCMPPARDRGITGGGGSCHKLNKLTYVWLSLQTRRGSIGLPGLSSRPYDVCVCVHGREESVWNWSDLELSIPCVCVFGNVGKMVMDGGWVVVDVVRSDWFGLWDFFENFCIVNRVSLSKCVKIIVMFYRKIYRELSNFNKINNI